jgi:hypothetical protein
MKISAQTPASFAAADAEEADRTEPGERQYGAFRRDIGLPLR